MTHRIVKAGRSIQTGHLGVSRKTFRSFADYRDTAPAGMPYPATIDPEQVGDSPQSAGSRQVPSGVRRSVNTSKNADRKGSDPLPTRPGRMQHTTNKKHDATSQWYGSVGLPGSRVLQVNGDPNAVNTHNTLPSGSRLLVKKDGAWIYETEVLQDQDDVTVDRFSCAILTDGTMSHEIVSVQIRSHRATIRALMDRTPNRDAESSPGRESSGAVQMVAEIPAHRTTRIQFPCPNDSTLTIDNLVILQTNTDLPMKATDDGHLLITTAGQLAQPVDMSCLIAAADQQGIQVNLQLMVTNPVTFSHRREA